MALDSTKVETKTQEEKIRDFIENHPNPNVKKFSQEIMQVAAEFDNNSKNTTTLNDVRKAAKIVTNFKPSSNIKDEILKKMVTRKSLKGQKVDSKSAGGLAGRLATRGYGKARR
jgi:hypothetical protein